MLCYRPVKLASDTARPVVRMLATLETRASPTLGSVQPAPGVRVVTPRLRGPAEPLRYELLSTNPDNGSFERWGCQDCLLGLIEQ